jgi:hypothetical protein
MTAQKSSVTCAGVAVVLSPVGVPRVIEREADDDHVLPATVSGSVDLITLGVNRHVLPLGRYGGIVIVTAREAVQRLETRAKP